MKWRGKAVGTAALKRKYARKARRAFAICILMTGVALLVSCPANDLLTDVQKKVNDYQASQNQAQITAFSFVGFAAYPGVIDQNNGTIAATLPYGTSLVGLVAAFTTSASSVKVGGVSQVSGVTANDFTNPVVYTTVGQNGSNKTYTVTVTIENGNLITSFSFQGYASNPGVIDSAAGTITVNLQYGTAVNALVAVFAITGVSVKVGSVVQTSGSTVNDFTNPLTYTVTASDGESKSYVATVNTSLTWTDQTAAGSRSWWSITSSSDGTKLAAVVNGGDIWTSIDSGATWTDQSAAGLNPWYSIASSADGTRLAAVVYGNETGVWISADSGATWANPINKGFMTSIASSSDGKTLAACSSNIWVSTDYGVTWTSNSNTDPWYWVSVTSSSDGTKLAAVVNGGDIYTSSNSGANWTDRTKAGTRAWLSITSSTDGTKLAAVVDGGDIWTSSDSGANWTDQSASGSKAWRSITSSSDGIKLAACEETGAGGNIWTSLDGGVHWTAQTAAGLRGWRSVTSSSDGTKLAACAEAGGNIWTGK